MTIGELLEKMSYSEFKGWLKYLSKPSEQEIQMAMVCTLISGFSGSKATLDDFLINKQTKKGLDNLTAEQIQELLNE